MAAVRHVAALLLLMAFAGSANAQGSLRLPPMPDAKPEAKPAETKPAPPPAAKPAPPAATAPAPAEPVKSGSQIQAIQLLLRDLGLYDNSTNGTLGPATRAAIREFQRSTGQPETGEPSDKLVDDLRAKKKAQQQ